MSAMNPINRVTKTDRDATAKRGTAVRAGNRFMAVAMPQSLAEFLSPGQIPLSHSRVHEPKPGSRQEEDTAMRYQPNAARPTGPVGRVLVPVVRRSLRPLPAEQANRQVRSECLSSQARLASDCHSPDRANRGRDSWRNSTIATRTDRPIAAHAK